jgi:hypothetical protein
MLVIESQLHPSLIFADKLKAWLLSAFKTVHLVIMLVIESQLHPSWIFLARPEAKILSNLYHSALNHYVS